MRYFPFYLFAALLVVSTFFLTAAFSEYHGEEPLRVETSTVLLSIGVCSTLATLVLPILFSLHRIRRRQRLI